MSSSALEIPIKPPTAPVVFVRRQVPGLVLVAAVALVARLVGAWNGFVPEAVIALILGMLANNVLKLPGACRPGIAFTHRYILRAAIIILGVGLSFAAILRTGGQTLIIVLVCLVVSFGLCLCAARLVGLAGRIGVLLGAGTAICGATAVLTIGPLIGATQAEIAYAIGTIFTYNALAVIFYPLVGHGAGLGALSFGTWVGTAVNDTSAVIATGYIYGDAAGIVATIVKLTRTVLLVPLAVLIGLTYSLRSARAGGQPLRVGKMVPWFIFGFLAMATLNTIGVFPPAVAKGLTELAKFLIVMVLASVGLGISLAQMRQMGVKPLLVGLLIGAVMGALSLGLIGFVGLG